jgi:hypothetical protein
MEFLKNFKVICSSSAVLAVFINLLRRGVEPLISLTLKTCAGGMVSTWFELFFGYLKNLVSF